MRAAITIITLAGRGPFGSSAVLVLGAGTYCYSLFWYLPPVVTGYREVAGYVAGHTPPGGVVVFSGYRDGNFVFAMREHPERGDLTVLRADKLLLKISVERLRGVEQSDMGEAGIKEMLKSNGVAMIVAQRDFWQDLREMARFTRVLESGDFHLVMSFPLTGNLEMNDGRDTGGKGHVDIFVPAYKVEPPKAPIAIELPIIGQTVTGNIGQMR